MSPSVLGGGERGRYYSESIGLDKGYVVFVFLILGGVGRYRGRTEIEGVSARSAGAYTTLLYVMVDIVKGGVRCVHPHPHQAG
jgi:hypothetical protein